MSRNKLFLLIFYLFICFFFFSVNSENILAQTTIQTTTKKQNTTTKKQDTTTKKQDTTTKKQNTITKKQEPLKLSGKETDLEAYVKRIKQLDPYAVITGWFSDWRDVSIYRRNAGYHYGYDIGLLRGFRVPARHRPLREEN